MVGPVVVVRTEGTDQLRALGQRLHEASDRQVTNAVRKSMREVAKPVGQEVVTTAAGRMPQRGRFAERVANNTRIGVTSATQARTVHVTITARNPGSDLAALNRGILRKPVFPRKGTSRSSWIWRTQTVPADTFTDALSEHAPAVRREVLAAMQTTLNNLTGGL